MHVSFVCPRCESPNWRTIAADQATLNCSQCDWSRPIAVEGQPGHCPACGCEDLWRQKDFPQALGVGIVAVGAILFAIAMALYLPVIAIGILLAFALVDLLLYVFMKDVLVCYRCQARVRNAPSLQKAPYFHLETFERYRQEATRLKDASRAS